MTSKILIAAAAAFMVTACGHKPLIPTRTELKVVRPDPAYFTCDKVQLPDPETLTDVQVAQLINDLVKANETCANNMNAIKQYLDAAEDVLEDRKKS
jgi:hypothetical protein